MPPQQPGNGGWVDDDGWEDDKSEQNPNQGFLASIWNKITTPTVSMRDATPQLRAGTDQFAKDHPWIGGGLNFLADSISGLSSPLNLATSGAFGGSGLALKAGLPKIAQGLNYAGRAASIPTAVEGAKHMGDNPIVGGLELLGGIAGFRTKLPEIGGRISAPNESLPSNVFHQSEPVTPQVHEPIEIVLKSPTKEQVADLRNRGYMPAGPNADGYPVMRKDVDPNLNNGMGNPELAGSQGYTRPTAKFKGWQQTGVDDMADFPLYDIEGGERHGSTVDPDTLRELGIEVPETPPNPYASTNTGGNRGNIPNEQVTEFSDKPTNLGGGKLREAYNLSRGSTTIWDLSAPGRQGLPLIHTKAWWGSWDEMLKAWGSEEAYKKSQAAILDRPNFKRLLDSKGKPVPSFAERVGLSLTDLGGLTKREEALMSTWAEKIPWARRSNRAYTAFLNQLRADHFDTLMRDAEGAGLNPKEDLVLSGKIAEYINNATGRGALKGSVMGKEINLEQNAKLLNDVFFAPRLMSSRIKMLNPANYVMQPAFIRKQYLKSMLSTGAAWGTINALGKLAGGELSGDTNSADFGKVQTGNTRLDPAGGFQQYLVLASRLVSGSSTSSTDDETHELGQGFKAPTRVSVATDFAKNKLHPVLGFAWDLFDASGYKPFSVGDHVAKMYVPMIAADVIQLAQEDPLLIPWLTPLIATGMGTQTYDEKGQGKTLFPDSMDLKFSGGNPMRDWKFGN